MNTITILVITIIILAVLLMSLVVWFTKISDAYSSEKLDLKIKLIRKETDLLQISNYALELINRSKTQIQFDTKTTKLIELAVNNKNENEARNAAMTVCRRIFLSMNKVSS